LIDQLIVDSDLVIDRCR